MKSLTTKILKSCLMTGAALLSLWGGAAWAESYDLVAGTTTVTMPDGKVVTIWGYGQCASNNASFAPPCPIQVPGPQLTVTDGTLTVNLRNDLAEPTSIVINGQNTIMTPVWINQLGAQTGTGSRPAGDYTSRVRSFTHEATVGGAAVYTWTGMKPGTFLYQTGTHPSKQVQMGLYGAATYNDGNYPGVPFAQDVVLLFSEIDPALHDAVANGTYGTDAYPSTIDYQARYFLINGKPFGAGQAPLNALTPAAAGGTILLRLLNAGLEYRSAVAQGQAMTVYGDDGNLLPHVFQQNEALLPPGKTMDVTITPAANGYIPVFDRRLGLSNAGASPGGMLAYLQVGAATPTLTVTKSLNVPGDASVAGTVNAISAPGGINCGLLCSQNYLTGTELILTAKPAAGYALQTIPWTGCTTPSPVGSDCLVTMDAPKTVTANFRKVTAVKLLTPNGGETLIGGQLYTISWEAPLTAVKFKVAYSIDNGVTWRRIKTGVTGNSFAWTVPFLKSDRRKVRVRVIAFNAAGLSIGRDRSDLPLSILRPVP